jgi:hypothetical protein
MQNDKKKTHAQKRHQRARKTDKAQPFSHASLVVNAFVDETSGAGHVRSW